MNITFNASEVLKALVAISPAMAKKVSVPILENVKVKVKDNGTMVLIAHDLEVSVAKIVKNVEADGVREFCINPKDLSKALSSLNKADERVSCEISENAISIHHSRGTIDLPIVPADDYVEMAMGTDMKEVSLKSDILVPWLNVGVGFTADDELRPILMTVYLTRIGGVLRFASTDSRKLVSSSIESDGDDFEAYFTSKVIRAMGLNIDTSESDTIRLRIGDGNRYAIRTSDTLIMWLAPIGKYPNFAPIIAKREGDTVVKVLRSELKESIKRTLVSTDEATAKITLVGSPDGTLVLNGEDLSLGKNSVDKIECEIDGAEFRIAVKGTILLDAVDGLDEEYVCMNIRDGRSAIMLYNVEDKSKVALVMPLVL